MRVLIADDGSTGASEAVALADAIAWPADSTLRVVTVIEPIVIPTAGLGDRGIGVAPELDAANAEMQIGDPASEIVAAAEARSADLIVLGSRGRTGVTRLLLGSVARNVVSGSAASVLIVRDGTGELSGPGSGSA